MYLFYENVDLVYIYHKGMCTLVDSLCQNIFQIWVMVFTRKSMEKEMIYILSAI